MIIGIVGTLGAGKGTVVAYLKERGFAHYSSSDRMRVILKERGLPADRAHLSALADELLQTYDGGILEYSYHQARKDQVEDFILESIHRQTEADFVRSIGGVLLGVDADTRTRYERAVKRQEGEKDNVTYEQFLADIEREEKGKGTGTPNIRAVLDTADYVVTNDGTIEELQQQIEAILKQIQK